MKFLILVLLGVVCVAQAQEWKTVPSESGAIRTMAKWAATRLSSATNTVTPAIYIPVEIRNAQSQDVSVQNIRKFNFKFTFDVKPATTTFTQNVSVFFFLCVYRTS